MCAIGINSDLQVIYNDFVADIDDFFMDNDEREKVESSMRMYIGVCNTTIKQFSELQIDIHSSVEKLSAQRALYDDIQIRIDYLDNGKVIEIYKSSLYMMQEAAKLYIREIYDCIKNEKTAMQKQLASCIETPYVYVHAGKSISVGRQNAKAWKISVYMLTDEECAALLASEYRLARYIDGTLQPL
jgi:ribosomal protein L30E